MPTPSSTPPICDRFGLPTVAVMTIGPGQRRSFSAKLGVMVVSRFRRARGAGRLASLLVASSLVLLAACSGDDSTTPASPAATSGGSAAATATSGGVASGMGSMSHEADPNDPNSCVARMPGELLTAAEAVVKFSSERVCPGYVTVAPGTTVTWLNRDNVARTVTVSTGMGTNGDVVVQQSVRPGEQFQRDFTTVGVFSYRTDAIPSFQGTIEVVNTAASGYGS